MHFQVKDAKKLMGLRGASVNYKMVELHRVHPAIMTRIITIILALNSYLPCTAWGEDLVLQYYETVPAPDNWPDSYYVLFGTFVAAAVLFIMSVMKKPDEIV